MHILALTSSIRHLLRLLRSDDGTYILVPADPKFTQKGVYVKRGETIEVTAALGFTSVMNITDYGLLEDNGDRWILVSAVANSPKSIGIYPETRNELKTLQIGPWIKDRILLIDLGFYKHQLFAKIKDNDGFFSKLIPGFGGNSEKEEKDQLKGGQEDEPNESINIPKEDILYIASFLDDFPVGERTFITQCSSVQYGNGQSAIICR